MRNGAARGFQAYPSPQKVTLTDCEFSGNAQGIQVSGSGGLIAEDITVVRGTFSNNSKSDAQAWWDSDTPQRPQRIFLIDSPTATNNVHPIYHIVTTKV
jgi:hypothetical protein